MAISFLIRKVITPAAEPFGKMECDNASSEGVSNMAPDADAMDLSDCCNHYQVVKWTHSLVAVIALVHSHLWLEGKELPHHIG